MLNARKPSRHHGSSTGSWFLSFLSFPQIASVGLVFVVVLLSLQTFSTENQMIREQRDLLAAARGQAPSRRSRRSKAEKQILAASAASLETKDSAVTTTRESSTEPLLTAVLVEIRCHAALPMILEQAIVHLGPQTPILVWHAPQNAVYVKHVVRSTSPLLRASIRRKQLQLRQFDPVALGSTNASISQYSGDFWYSRLLKSDAFYQSVTTPFLLNMQADTLLCQPLNAQLLTFPHEPQRPLHFLGALAGDRRTYRWMENPEAPPGSSEQVYHRRRRDLEWDANPRPHTPLVSDVSGGLSLRNVSWALGCLYEYNHLRSWTEDDLLNYCLFEERPLESQAFAFASDEGKTLCFDARHSDYPELHHGANDRVCPFGVHKPWLKVQKWWTAQQYDELERSCPGLKQLELSQYLEEHDKAGKCTVRARKSSKTYKIPCQCPAVPDNRPRLHKRRLAEALGEAPNEQQ